MLKQVLTLSLGSSFGKILGVVREILLANFFGTGAVADAFRAAMTATLAPVHIFTTHALSSSFIPQFRKDRENKDASSWVLFNSIGLLLLFIGLMIGGCLYFLAATWASLLFPGFVEEQFQLTVKMIEIMALGIPLYTLSSLLISMEIGSGRFSLASLRAFVQNLGIIIALIFAFSESNPVWIAWGFTGTYILFVIIGSYRMIRTGILERGWHLHWNKSKQVVKRFWFAVKPLTIFSLLNQANIMVEKAIASIIGQGAVAAVDYARLIPESSQVILIVPLGMVSLSAMVNLRDEEVIERCDRILSIILLLLVPLSCIMLISAPDIIRLVYGRGAFDDNSVLMTSQALRGMSIGAWAVCLAYVLQKVYNSRIRNRDVLRIGATGVLANALFNIMFYKYLGVMAIGLGFSIGGFVMAWLYIRGIGKMVMMRQIAKLFLVWTVPYLIVAVTLYIYFSLQTIIILAIQIVWALMFWVSIFLVSPVSRDILQQLIKRIFSLGAKN